MKNYVKECKSSLSDTFLDEKATGLCLYTRKPVVFRGYRKISGMKWVKNIFQ